MMVNSESNEFGLPSTQTPMPLPRSENHENSKSCVETPRRLQRPRCVQGENWNLTGIYVGIIVLGSKMLNLHFGCNSEGRSYDLDAQIWT